MREETPRTAERASETSQHCPYLGLRADPPSIFAEPTEEHRCHIGERTRRVDLDHQGAFCLTSSFEACPQLVVSPDVPTDGRPAIPSAPNLGGTTDVDRSHPRSLERPPRLSLFLDEIPAVELAIWAGITVVVMVAVYWYLARPLPGAVPPPDVTQAAVAPSPSKSAPRAEAPVAVATLTVPAPTSTVVTATPVPPLPTVAPAPGQRLAALTPAGNAVGWVSSGDRLNHFGDRNLHVGVFEGRTYYGAMQFSLASIPVGARIEYATVELVGLNAENVGADGSWTLHLLSSEVDTNWPSATYDQIHNAPVVHTIPPAPDRQLSTTSSVHGSAPDDPDQRHALHSDDLAAGRVNVFTFTPAQRAELEGRLESGLVSFRLDGPTEGDDNLFTWDTGYGGGYGNRPVLRVVYAPPPTLTPIVVTATPSPANVVTVAALAATATYQATVVGTATPWPPNIVTATPPIVITNTPTPGNQATAEWMAAVATAQAVLYGTPTPLPTGVWTVTPAPPTPTRTRRPTPTPTWRPLLIPIGRLPTGTPTPIATPTPSSLPAVLRGKIAFLSDRLGEPAVFVIDPDGSDMALLTDRWAYDRALELDTFSPDRSQRLLVKGYRNQSEAEEGPRSEQTYEIWGQNTADGWTWYLTGRGRVTYDPVWSPTSGTIAFVGQVGGNDEIFVIHKDTGQETRLTYNDWEWDKHPSWSPDGRQIVFWSNRGTGRRQIWIMNADGSDQRPLFQDEWNNWDPVWIK